MTDTQKPRVVASSVWPPIATRRFDFCATFEGYEPGDPVGYGSTREAAETDLMEQVYEAADH